MHPLDGSVQGLLLEQSSPNQWVDESPHPWRRYFARTVDNVFWGTLIMLVVGIALALYDVKMAEDFAKLFEGLGGRVASIVLSAVLCTIPNAILIGLTGGNLGKWLFGICVFDRQDRPIGLLRAFQREFRVLLLGLGLGVPVVSLITSLIAYQKLREDRITNWDQALNLKVLHRKRGALQYLGYSAGLVLFISLIVFLKWLNTL